MWLYLCLVKALTLRLVPKVSYVVFTEMKAPIELHATDKSPRMVEQIVKALEVLFAEPYIVDLLLKPPKLIRYFFERSIKFCFIGDFIYQLFGITQESLDNMAFGKIVIIRNKIITF